MLGSGPAADALLALAQSPNMVPPTPSAQAAGPTPHNLTYNFPQPPVDTGTNNLVDAINKLNRVMDAKGIIGEFEWESKVREVNDQTMMSSTPMVFAMRKE